MLGSLILYLKGHEDNDVPTFLASTVEPASWNFGFLTGGLGSFRK